MKCPNCGYEVGPFSNAAGVQPIVHNCALLLNAAVAMPLMASMRYNWGLVAAYAPEFDGIAFDVNRP